MALSATMRRFAIELADADHDHYGELDLRVAQHPSESERFLVARVIARALEDAEGVDFGKGLAADDEPAISQRNLRGELQAWIEVGYPTPDRLHKAAKLCKRVVIYGWNRLDALAGEITERGVHKREAIELYELAPELLDAAVATLDRNNTWSLAVSGGEVYLTIGEVLCQGTLRKVEIG